MGKMILNGIEYNGSIPSDSGVIYSDEEREVGVWRDGKPLYQKTVDMGSFTTGYGEFPHGISDIDRIIDYHFIGKRSNGDGGWFDSNSVGNDILLTINKTNVYRSSNNVACEKAYLTMQYTKTTDIPGSGAWTTQGGYAHHYSTTEHIIGTWIDGKTIYEKVFNLSNAEIAVDTFYKIPNTDYTQYDTYIYCYLIDEYNQAWCGSAGYSESRVAVVVHSNRTRNYKYAIIQYTKTTD